MTGIVKKLTVNLKWPGNILHVFNNLKIVTKLVGGFSIVLFLIFCVIWIYHGTVKSTTNNFKDLMEVNVALEEQAGELKTVMKQCRIEEMNFLSTLEKKYLEQLDKNIQSLSDKAQSIVEMSQKANSDATAELAANISEHVEKYNNSFRDLVSAYEKRGLDINSGLRGAFEATAKIFIRDLSYVDVEDLYVHMLKIVKLQNEFILTKDLEFQAKLAKALAEYDQVIAKSDADDEIVKVAIHEVLSEYSNSLKKMVASVTWDEKRKHLEDMREIIEEINEFLSMSYLPNSKAYILKIRSSEKDYLLFGGESYINKVHENISILSTEMKNSTIGEDYLVNSNKAIKKYKDAFDALATQDKRINKLYSLMSKEANDIEEHVDELYHDARNLSSARTLKVNTQAGNRSSLALTIGILSILLGFTLAFFITRQITLPIIKAVIFSKKMSKGDFTSRLDIDQKDEIGSLANALNGIVTNLGGMFRDIAMDVNVLSSSSENLRTISEQMAKGSEGTAFKSNTVASAAEEMNANLSSVAAAMEETSVNLNSVAAATEENTATISEIAENSHQAKNISNEAVIQAKNASGDMEQLENAAKDIGTVTETITKISEQTNLLALNATIEAARAGEAGRGFTVVANEIKELAQQTAEATKEIKSRITGIQDTTSSTIKSIEQITTIIDQVNEIISKTATTIGEQSTATQEIGGNIAQASLGIQEVNENVAQCSSVAGEITKDIAGVNQEAGEMSSSSSQLNMSAEELAELAEKLKKMVGQFEV